MRTPYWLLALALGLGALVAAPAADPSKADAERIAKLVKQLGSDGFEEREKAAKELEEIGTPALDALRAAAKDGDADLKTRAGGLIDKIEKEARGGRLLAPTKVKLLFKDTPLAAAVAEFNKKSGYTIEVHDPDKKLKDRKVTVDTGEVTFWEAFDKFCEKADVVEATWQDLMPRAAPGAVPPPPPDLQKKPAANDKEHEPSADDPPPAQATPPPLPPPPPINQPPGAGGAPFPGGFGLGAGSRTIIVVDGKPKSLPTCYADSVRLRALKEVPNLGFAMPPGPPGAGRGAAKDDNYTVWVELRGEPKLQVLGIESVALTKTTDDQDQKLEVMAPAGPPVGPPRLPGAAPPGGLAPPAPPGGGRGPAMVPVTGGFMSGPGGTQYHAVRLKKGEKESKALKELAGTITTNVMPPPWPLITADNIAKAEGQTFKGKDGGLLKVAEVKEEDGKLTVQFELEQALGYLPASSERIPVSPAPGGGAAQPDSIPAAPGVSLLDENGKAIAPTGAAPTKWQFVPGSVRKGTFTQEYKLDKGQKPAKLVYSGSRMANLDVPFSLKDVPLR